jgi:hypothetical protein
MEEYHSLMMSFSDDRIKTMFSNRRQNVSNNSANSIRIDEIKFANSGFLINRIINNNLSPNELFFMLLQVTSTRFNLYSIKGNKT